jgi:hypothetical protein
MARAVVLLIPSIKRRALAVLAVEHAQKLAKRAPYGHFVKDLAFRRC